MMQHKKSARYKKEKTAVLIVKSIVRRMITIAKAKMLIISRIRTTSRICKITNIPIA